MARISKGILGGVSGKIGNVIGGSWKGIDYLRILPANVANPRTPKQVDQRTKFMRVIRFLQPLTEFLRIGFRPYANRMTAFNAALSYNFKHAITGVFPDYDIDLTKALISRGSLPGAVNASVSATQTAEVELQWDDNSGDSHALGSDKAAIVAYNTAKEKAVVMMDAATRSAGNASLQLPSDWSGDTVDCFITFTVLDALVSSGGKKAISNSAYAGNVAVL